MSSFQQQQQQTNSLANIDNFDRQSINSGSGSIATLNDEFSSTLSSLSNSSYQHQQHQQSQSSQLTTSASASDFVKLQQQEKIIQDYVKVRNKLSILKNAYKELSETCVQKDQSMRKYEQEIESLNFRNQQLTSRVENLQKELLEANLGQSVPSNGVFIGNGGNQLHVPPSQSVSSSPVSSTTSASSSSSSNGKMQRNNSNVSNSSSSKLDVMSEELQHKISENVALNRRLNEIEVEFRQKLAKSEQLLKQVEGEKMMIEKKLESTESSSKTLVDKLQSDKIKLELHVIQLENQLRTLYQEEKEQEEESSRQVAPNGSAEASCHSEPAPKAVETSLLADMFHSQVDCLGKIYLCLDEIADNAKPRKQHSKLALRCEQLLKQLPFTVTGQSRPNSPAPPSNQEKADFDRLLNEFFDANHSLIQSIVAEMSSSQSDSGSQAGINKKLKIYLNKLDTFLFVNASQSSSSSLNSSSGHSSPVAKADHNTSSSTSSFVSHLSKLLHILLFSKSSQVQQVVQLLNNNAFQRGLSLFIDILEKILFVLNEKLSLEYSSADQSSTVVLTNDECIVSYLTQLKQTLNQFAGLLETGSSSSLTDAVTRLVTQVNMLTTGGEAETGGVDLEDELEKLKAKLAEKEQELAELQLKYEELKSKALNDVQDTERLKSKLEQLQTQFLKQKQDNQTLAKELDELKLQQQQQNDHLLQQQLELQSLKSMSNSNSDQSIGLQKEPETIVQTEEKPKPAAPVQVAVSDSQDASERLTIDFCLAKIDELNEQIKILDGKALFYYEEMNCVLERLRSQVDENVKQENELAEVKDQLERTRNTYEMQMSTMSDHLITVNESLTKQAEENERLKHELSTHVNNIPSSNTPLLSATGSKASSNSSSKSKKTK